MARLPQPGGDEGQWGDILNEYLLTAHAADGTLKDATAIASIGAKYTRPSTGIPESDLSSGVVAKLNATSTGYVKPTNGIPEADLDTAVVNKLNASNGITNTRVVITHATNGVVTLDHSAGNYFDINATANITGITEINQPTVGDFWIRIYANGVDVTIDLSSLELDDELALVGSVTNGEALIAQGVVLP